MGFWFRFKSSLRHRVGQVIFLVVLVLVIIFVWALIQNGGNIMAVLDSLMGG